MEEFFQLLEGLLINLLAFKMESNFKKMFLVPYHEKTVNVDLEPLEHPVKNAIKKNLQEKTDIITSNLDEEGKQKKLNRNIETFSVLSEKVLNKTLKAPPVVVAKNRNVVEYDLLPKQVQGLAGKIVDIIKKSKKIKIHANGEISIQNKKLKNSNINDLIADVLRNRKQGLPPHGEKFIHFLSEINLPQSFIKNKKRLNLYKKFLNENSAKPQLKVPPRKKRKVEDFKFLNSDL